MFKVVYSLISDFNDYYTEQALLSMYSLRMHNPTLSITLVADTYTWQNLQGTRKRILEYIDERVVVDVPLNMTRVQKSRFLKTSLRSLVNGDFLYLDNDTIVIDNLLELQNFAGDIGGVPDHHSKTPNVYQISLYLDITRKSNWLIGNNYYNGGVLFVRDSSKAKRLFDLWHKIWLDDCNKFGVDFDQASLNTANAKCGNTISELDGIYNVQILKSESFRYLFRPKIIHYYYNASERNFFIMSKKDILEKIRDHGVTTQIEKLINDWFISIVKHCHYLTPMDGTYFNKPMYVLGCKLARDYPWTNIIARLLYRLMGYRI